MAKSITAAALVFSCMISTAWAQNSCVRPQDMTALQTATVQQRFMVAALTCDTAELYNSFVRAYRGDLQKSDVALRAYFVRRDAATGVSDYNAFKTKLAGKKVFLTFNHEPENDAKNNGPASTASEELARARELR